jgi:cation:H+ antiporter
MIINLFLLFLGLILLVKSADVLVDGTASLAKKWGMSGLLIGLTVISFGTSLPEVLVNLLASFKGSHDIGMGNIIGSNISNTLLVLGIILILAGSLRVDKSILNKQVPFSILSVIVLFVLANGTLINGNGSPGGLFRSGGIVLLCFFCIFLYFTFSEAKNEEESNDGEVKERKSWASWLMTIGGLAGLYLGAELTVSNAEIIARLMGMSEALIGITIIGLGTSLPELIASIIAAIKRQAGMAIGNIIGSNIFNILWVLGVSSLIKPIQYSPMLDLDIALVLISTLILFPLIIFGKKNYLTRSGGIILVLFYLTYLIFVIIRG